MNKLSSVLGPLKEMVFLKPKEPVQQEREPLRWVVIENGKTVIKESGTPFSGVKKKKEKLPVPVISETTKRSLLTCEASGYKIECKGIMCRAHIISQQYRPFAANKNNSIYICKDHETYFNNVGNEEWFAYIREFHKEKFQWVADRCKQIIKECKIVLELIKRDVR